MRARRSRGERISAAFYMHAIVGARGRETVRRQRPMLAAICVRWRGSLRRRHPARARPVARPHLDNPSPCRLAACSAARVSGVPSDAASCVLVFAPNATPCPQRTLSRDN